jgi:hypothetical protein
MLSGRFNTEDVARICTRKLGIQFRMSGERNGWYIYEGRRVARITVAHGRKPIPPKTYKSMATQLKLTVDQFDELLSCPMSGAEYSDVIAAFVAAQFR